MRWKDLGLIVLCLFPVVVGCVGPESFSKPTAQIFSCVPAEIDPAASYLIYLHGAIIENEGVRPTHAEYGVYEYREILEVLAERGFVVISEARPPGTDGMLYASTVVDQVQALLDAGVAPNHVTVVGFSKGGGIAVVASSMLAHDDVNFVFIAACAPWLDGRPEIVGRGRLLALREVSDALAGSCGEFFERSPSVHEHREILLDLGGGHGAFYRPHAEWIDPIVEWAGLE